MVDLADSCNHHKNAGLLEFDFDLFTIVGFCILQTIPDSHSKRRPYGQRTDLWPT